MRISRIQIDKYGPLSDIKLVPSPGFQCIYGPNESGKTLLIDAILKLCLGKKQRKSIRNLIDRVTGEPKGWITFNDDNREVTVDEKTTLAEVLETTSDELRDIFVIRNSDLAFLDEKSCLGQLTERILSLRTQDIIKIQKALRERGRLTESTGALISTGGRISPKNQVDTAKAIIGDIDEYLQSDEVSMIAADEKRCISLQIRENELNAEVDELERAQKWLELRDIESATTTASQLLMTQQTIGKEPESRILMVLNRHDNLKLNQAKIERELKQLRALSIIAAIGLSLSAALAMLYDEGFTGVLQTCAVLVLSILTVALWLRRSRALGEIEASRLAVIELGRSYDESCRKEEEARRSLNDIIEKSRSAAGRLEGQISLLRSHLKTKSQDSQHILELARERINELGARLGNETNREFREQDLETAKGLLREVQKELGQLRDRLKKHYMKLADIDKQVAGIRFEEHLRQPLGVTADSLDSLNHLKSRLGFFVSQIEEKAQYARTALSLFEQLRAEEEGKVSALLSQSSRASEVFSDITGGSYVRVNYLPNTRSIEVIDKNDATFAPENLSRGTKDQLYLSVRVALGEKLLRGKTGFFIMDDPFLTSDLERAERQYEVVHNLVRAGWQVVLFTAREDLAKSLDERFDGHRIVLSPIR